MDLGTLRADLKALEDDEEGMPFPDTHEHYTDVTFGLTTLAHVFLIINGYTVTFEDGQYAVDIYGENTNLLDVVNLNQVSVRANNSAGLVVYEGGGLFDMIVGVP
jgi:hypothetical protein